MPRPFVLPCLPALLATNLLSAPIFAAPRQPPTKSPAPAKKGIMLEGTGELKFEATLSNRGANLLSTSYSAREKDERGDAASRVTASKRGGVNAIVTLSHSAPKPVGEVELRAAMTISFGSKNGFYAGQSIPIALPKYEPGTTRPATALLDYTQNEIREVEGRRGRKDKKQRYSSWSATRGTLTIEAVSRDKVAFRVTNAVFDVPKFRSDRDAARGSFVLNGKGVARLTEIPDGFC